MRLPPRLPDAPVSGVQEQWRIGIRPVPDTDKFYAHCWRCNWLSKDSDWPSVAVYRQDHRCPPRPIGPQDDDGR